MNSESGSSLPVSVEDNEEIRNTVDFGDSGETRVHNNGSCEAQNKDYNELLSDVKEKGTEASDSVSSSPTEKKSEASLSPSPATIRKGYGLKKWKRIKRDARKVGESSGDTGKMVIQESPNSVVQPSKRAQVYAERDQKSEGSVSSRNLVVGNSDGFTLFSDPNLVMGPSMDAGTDSENSSSKSSTTASVPKVKYDVPVVVGFPHDKNRVRNLSGKKLVQKGRIDTIKKARGDRAKTEKENSHSSLESDSRSSNHLFMLGTHPTSNGIRSERHDGENGDEVQGGRENGGAYQDISPQHVNADLSQEDKKEKSENHGSSSEQDPLVDAVLVLQTAQEALEKEVLKIKEISKDILVDDSVSDVQPEITDFGKNFQQTSSSDGASLVVHPEMVELAKRELEDLYMKRIEAEVEYLTLSRTVHKLRVDAEDRTTSSQEYKTPVSEKKNIMLKKEAVKLENCCEDSASSDETLKLQKKVCKYTSYFLVQLLSLLVIIGIFMFQSSPNYVEVVPT